MSQSLKLYIAPMEMLLLKKQVLIHISYFRGMAILH